jgi:hypothetical protein
MAKLLVVTRPGRPGEGDLSEYIYPFSIESIRLPDLRQHTSESNAVIRTQSGREIAVLEHYHTLVERWEELLLL